MQEKVRRLIDELAETVLHVIKVQSPIQDMAQVVKILGGRLEEIEEISQYSDGYIMKNDPEDPAKFTISIPRAQNQKRKKFTIAHEIGHLFIDMGYMVDDQKWNNSCVIYNRAGSSHSERMADEFAAAFLMPTDIYKHQVQEHTNIKGEVDIQAVAGYFGVSVDAARNRGCWLGMLSW